MRRDEEMELMEEARQNEMRKRGVISHDTPDVPDEDSGAEVPLKSHEITRD